MIMLVLMTLTLMQGHSGSNSHRCMLICSATIKQAISIKLATTVYCVFFYDLQFANVYMA